jgi:SAM-dependent methyltransferase
VLELGCGEGAFAEAYKRRNPRAFYAAVEIYPPAAAVARGRIDHVVEADFETLDDAELADLGLFDVVLMGDVLEHLKDPWRALGRIRRLLSRRDVRRPASRTSPTGSVLGQLLSGHWNYKDSACWTAPTCGSSP